MDPTIRGVTVGISVDVRSLGLSLSRSSFAAATEVPITSANYNVACCCANVVVCILTHLELTVSRSIRGAADSRRAKKMRPRNLSDPVGVLYSVQVEFLTLQ